ncbi:myosin-13-like isoform X2 [Salvelinus alpinus]|uniref:myosin-13-like isoform X2 n=1 Tax=Salvelinus alpinus TaxID=8036 RepID=UPI0039FDCCC5
MSSRGKGEGCLVCGGDLHGNQRRWLFGGQNKKDGQPQTPSDSPGRGSLSRSSQGSPWGSTMSLGSTTSLSSLSSPAKAMDLLSVLTHILGQSVPRGSGRGEFLCGKCVSVLERVFKFDSVISRVRVLSSERLQKLTQERDKVRQWVRSAYRQRHPQDFRMRSSTSEEDGEGMGDREGYNEMLKENMALSEYECWSEKWDACPYFRRTGKRCTKGKNCEGCDSLRVSDSAYESVCGVPRRLPFQPFPPLALSRNKSQSMPLHWSRVPSLSSSPASLAGSTLSLRASSRTESIQSLDSLDCRDPFDFPGDLSLLVLRELKGIEGKPVNSPSGSKIPILGKREGRYSGEVGETSPPKVTRVLNFGERENGGEEVDGETNDVLTELRDEFIPLHRESNTGRVHLAVRQLRGQLDQAMARIKTLETELKHGTKTKPDTNVSGPEDWIKLPQKDGGNLLLQSLGHSLHSRDRVIQLALGALRSEMSEKEKRMESELEALKKAGRDREKDLSTLNTVLQCNQDIINELRVELVEKERGHREVQKEREVWRQRDQALKAVLQEKESLLLCLKQALESSQKDMQALSDSVISQGVSGGGAERALASQLKEKESLVIAWLQDREEHSATMCREVSKLTTALQDYQSIVQEQQQNHSQTVSSLSKQLNETANDLRERGKENKETQRAWRSEKEDKEREERNLRESLEKRDKLIEQVLLDSEERDHLLKELQQNLLNKFEPMIAVKHTL